jgi:hypothetical protein
MLKNSRTPLSEKLQKMCGQEQKNMWSKLKTNTPKKTVEIEVSHETFDLCPFEFYRVKFTVSNGGS